MITAIQLLAGLALLYYGADILVRGGSRIAFALGVTPLVIGLTLIAAATSAPELVVSLTAALSGSGGLSAGNVIGSNICNVALILGVSALIRPIPVGRRLLRLDLPVLAVAVAVFAAAGIGFGVIGRGTALVLLAGMIGYILRNLYCARHGGEVEVESDEVDTTRIKGFGGWLLAGTMVVGGAAMLTFGGDLLVKAAVTISRHFGVSDAVVGLTVVAIGTSLPELATSVLAAIRGQRDIAIGNVVGSNIFNILSIMGIAPLLRPVDMTHIGAADWAVLGVTTAALFLLALSPRGVTRRYGVILLALYIGYTAYLVVSHT